MTKMLEILSAIVCGGCAVVMLAVGLGLVPKRLARVIYENEEE